MDFTKSYPNPVNRDKFREDLNAANFIELIFRTETFTVLSVSAPDEATIDSIVASHNATILTTAQQEEAQATSAKTALKALTNGLQGLSAVDKGYSLYCRLLAWRDGANQQTINAIVDRPTAVAYVTSKPEWVAATAATRALLGDILEADAALCMVLLLVL